MAPSLQTAQGLEVIKSPQDPACACVLILPAQVYLERFPQFVGRTFGSIALQLPDGIAFGIVNHFRSGVHARLPIGLSM